jgi:hypothetical protein
MTARCTESQNGSFDHRLRPTNLGSELHSLSCRRLVLIIIQDNLNPLMRDDVDEY